MFNIILTAGLCLIFASLGSSQRLVCYFNSLAEDRADAGKFTIADIDPKKCTHLIYAFSDIDDFSELVPTKRGEQCRYKRFNELKTKNPSLKTLLSVGGQTFNKEKFTTMVSTKEKRTTFIQSAVDLLRRFQFDGLNLDWMYPVGAGGDPNNKQKFTLLCKEINAAFKTEGQRTNRDRLIITASVSAERDVIDASYEVKNITKDLDFLNVLTLDFHGPWESVTGHHSPLFRGSQDTGDKIYYNTDSAMQYWVAMGAPAQSLNLGIAAYGRAFTLSSGSTGVGATACGPGREGCYTGEEGFWSYYETCLYTKGATVQRIPDQKVPFAVTENQWVGFDDTHSVSTKVNYLKENNFGGAFVWSLDLDDFSGKFCNQSKSPFISHLNSLLVQSPIGTTTATTTVKVEGGCNGRTSGMFPNPSDKTTFYNCGPDGEHIQKCPAGLVFNDTCKCCDYPSPATALTPTPISSAQGGCNGRTSGLFPNPSDKTTFYNCGPDGEHIQKCPAGLVFNDNCKCCDWPSPAMALTPISSAQGGCNGRTSGTFPNPSDKTTFYNCGPDGEHIQKCPAGLVFNDNCKCCDWPSPAMALTPISSAQGGCNGRTSGTFPNPSDKTTFYNCGPDGEHIQKCPAGLVFNDNCKCCDWPSPAMALTPISSAQGGCNGRTSGTFPNPSDKTTFYNCGPDGEHIQKCPAGLVFNDNCKCCDWPSPAMALTPISSAQGGCNGRTSGTFPNPSDKTTFYKCGPDGEHIQKCPAGLVFNDNCKCCDWPSPAMALTPISSAQGGCNGRTSGTFPNPSDKTTFYNCGPDGEHIQKCPAGLVFNDNCKCCDWPSPATALTPISSAQGGCNGRTSGTFPNPSDNTSFYNCGPDGEHIQKCPAGLVFNDTCKCCDYPSPATALTPTPISRAQGGCNGRTSGTFPNPSDKTTFYNCGPDGEHIQKCPAGLVFNDTCKCCDWPSPATALTPTPISSAHGGCNGRTSGLFPNPSDKTTFYNCGPDGEHIQKCPAGLVFNDNCKCCDWPSPAMALTPISSAQGGCNGRTSGTFPNPSDNTSFYNCGPDGEHIQKCPAGLVFNDNCKCCDWPSPAMALTPISSAQGGCNGRTSGTFPNPSDKTTFYNCGPDGEHIQKCPAGLVFNDNCKCCDWPSPATALIPISSAQGGCNGRTSGLFPNPSDNTSFYNCGPDGEHIQKCPAGLVFNDTCKCCDWPSPATALTPTPISSAQGGCNGRTSGTFPNPSDKTTFYNCGPDGEHIQKCPAGLVFNDNCKCCDWPSPATALTPTPISSAQGGCNGRTSGLFPNPSDNTSFYNCGPDGEHIQKCPAGLVFKTSCTCCTWP